MAVSTAHPSHETPNGGFRGFSKGEDHYSKECVDAARDFPHQIRTLGIDTPDRLGFGRSGAVEESMQSWFLTQLLRFGCRIDFWHLPAAEAEPDAPWTTHSTCVICGALVTRIDGDWQRSSNAST
jgi:hypothetical protein